MFRFYYIQLIDEVRGEMFPHPVQHLHVSHVRCLPFLSVHSGRRQPEGLLRLRPERPEGPGVRPVRPGPRGGHRQGLTLQLPQHHPAQRLPHPGGGAAAVPQLPPAVPGLPRAGEEACGGILDSGGFRGGDQSVPHHLLHNQETQGLLLTIPTVGLLFSFLFVFL